MTPAAPAATFASPEAALQALRRELAESLERQAATSEILRVISRSPTDPQPAFDAIVAAGVRLFPGAAVAISREEGGLVRALAIAEDDAERAARWRRVFPFPLSREYIHGAAILDRQVVDVADVLETGGQFEVGKRNLAPSGYRAMTVVPLLCAGAAIGAIAVVRMQPGPLSTRQVALLQTFADQAVIAIENTRLFKETQRALERQTATAEVLRVISGSVTDTQPVFDVIAERAARLTNARSGWVFTFDGEWIHPASSFGLTPEALAAALALFPMRPGGASYTARAIRDGVVMNMADALAEADPAYATKQVARLAGYRAVLSVPMFRGPQVLGAISVNRAEVGLFTEHEVELLRTFADQAVIAIENTRLSNEREARNRELAEALEQQTATSEILRVISRSPTDVQPVFDTIVAHAAPLCEAHFAFVMLHEAGRLTLAARTDCTPEFAAYLARGYAADRSTTTGRAVLQRTPVQVCDFQTEAGMGVTTAHRHEHVRTVLAVPLLRDERVLGVIAIWRREVRAFSAEQIALLQTFADQAVIAIENTRLFNEREARNRELAEALAQQTATGEILRVISRSPTDTRPVFDAIAAAARALCRARSANLLTFDGKLLHLAARAIESAEALEAAQRLFPRAAGDDTVAGRAVLTRRVVAIPDALEDADYAAREVARLAGSRSFLGVPLLRDGEPIGALVVGREEAGAVPDQLIALMQTFADQAVIAIENARLFTELQDKTRELEIAGRHKSAFLANMSHELRTPLNAILGFTRIVQRETREAIAPRQADNLDKILASARHLVGLINATLDLTRIEAGRIEITAGETPLAPLLDECVRSVEPLLAGGVRLESHVAAELPPIWVDVAKLHQIVLNLLGNAVKFTERGRIELRAAQRDGHIEIEVEDTGIGIPADKLEAVFEEFEQVDASHTRAHGGTGLGLAIGRRLARAMGGELTARSTLDQGSTFTLTLPLRWSDADEA